jgi:hypothetical protein
MAFNLQNFQFGRGVVTAYTQGQGFTSVQHTYKSDTDTRATIAGADYFPPFIDGDADQVFIDDSLFIIGSDGVSLVIFTSVDPIVLGTDLLVSGPTLTMVAPANATDANGAIISGNTLKIELATASNPGSISTTNQTFSGVKAFDDGVNANGQGVVANQINAGGALALPIGNVLTTSVDFTPVVNVGASGIVFDGGTNLTLYTEATGTLVWDVAFAAPPTITWYAKKQNGWVSLSIKGMPAAAAAGAAIGSSDSGVFIPVGYRPLANIEAPIVLCQSNGTITVGLINVATTGNVVVYATAAGGLFANAGNNQIHEINITYNILT